jgi:hypothetical protein
MNNIVFSAYMFFCSNVPFFRKINVDLRCVHGLLLLLHLELELVDVDGGHLPLHQLHLLNVELSLPLHGLGGSKYKLSN